MIKHYPVYLSVHVYLLVFQSSLLMLRIFVCGVIVLGNNNKKKIKKNNNKGSLIPSQKRKFKVRNYKQPGKKTNVHTQNYTRK